MFFTPLTKKGGPYYTIWKAAMLSKKLAKREILNVDIEKTCVSLIEYFRPEIEDYEKSINGFSLRLSSQLAYGVILIYSLQVHHLLKDTEFAHKAMITWWSRQKSQMGIDLPTQRDVDEHLLEDLPNLEHFYDTIPPLDFDIPSRHAAADLASITMVEDIAQGFPETMPTMTEFDQVDENMIRDMFPHDFDSLQNVTPNDQIHNLPTTPLRPSKSRDQSGRRGSQEEERKNTDRRSRSFFGLEEDDRQGLFGVDISAPAAAEIVITPPSPEKVQETEIPDQTRPEVTLNPEEDLVLGEISENAFPRRKKKSKLLIDQVTVIPSETFKKNLATSANKSEDDVNLPRPKAKLTANQLFASACHETVDITQKNIDPYQKRTKKGRHEILPLSVPIEEWNDALEHIKKHLYLPPFSAFEEMFGESPEPQFSDVMDQEPNVGPLEAADQGLGGEEEQPLPQETYKIDFEDEAQTSAVPESFLRESISEERNRFDNISNVHSPDLSNIPVPDENIPEKSDETPLESLSDKVESMPEEVSVGQYSSSRESIHSEAVSTISEKLRHSKANGENSILFSALVPPKKVSRPKAVSAFTVILKLAKDRSVGLSQESAFGEIWIDIINLN